MNTDLVKERLASIDVEQLGGLPHALVEVQAGDFVFIPAGVATMESTGPELAVGVRASCYVEDESSIADLKVALSMFEAAASPFASKLQQILTIVEAGIRAGQQQHFQQAQQVADAPQPAASAPLAAPVEPAKVSGSNSHGILESCDQFGSSVV